MGIRSSDVWDNIDQIEFPSAYMLHANPTLNSVNGFELLTPQTQPPLSLERYQWEKMLRFLHATPSEIIELRNLLESVHRNFSTYPDYFALMKGPNNAILGFLAAGLASTAISFAPVIIAGAPSCLISLPSGFLAPLITGFSIGTGAAQNHKVFINSNEMNVTKIIFRSFMAQLNEYKNQDAARRRYNEIYTRQRYHYYTRFSDNKTFEKHRSMRSSDYSNIQLETHHGIEHNHLLEYSTKNHNSINKF